MYSEMEKFHDQKKSICTFYQEQLLEELDNSWELTLFIKSLKNPKHIAWVAISISFYRHGKE
jgi:hypothetical protein